MECNMSTLERITDFKLNDIQNIRSANILVNLCEEYHVDINTLPLKRNEIEALGYIGPGKQVLTHLLEFFFKDNS